MPSPMLKAWGVQTVVGPVKVRIDSCASDLDLDKLAHKVKWAALSGQSVERSRVGLQVVVLGWLSKLAPRQ